MLKRIKLKNSTVLLIGLILILLGISIGFIEHFNQRKEDVYSKMNIRLYENEIPENIQLEQITEEENEIIEEEIPEPEKEPEKPTETKYNYIGMLEIPKINLKRGFVEINSKYNDVKYNITVIKGSTFPDEKNNNLIMAAHSGVCSICFFNKLFNLSIGDRAYINYKNVRYTYSLVNTYEVEKDGTVAIYRDYSKKVLTLITCTKNSNTKQTVFIFELEE